MSIVLKPTDSISYIFLPFYIFIQSSKKRPEINLHTVLIWPLNYVLRKQKANFCEHELKYSYKKCEAGAYFNSTVAPAAVSLVLFLLH
jgi:hypothetical protein